MWWNKVVLSRPDIIARLNAGDLIVDPLPDESRIDQVSIDLRLGRNFFRFKPPPAHIATLRVKPSLFTADDLWDRHEADTFDLRPDEFVLAETLERVVIPNDLVGFVEGRSSWARVGLSIHVTAPKIDPGFDGKIALEIKNVGSANIQLAALDDQPAQILFMRLTTPLTPDQLYGEDELFQHQSAPLPSSDH